MKEDVEERNREAQSSTARPIGCAIAAGGREGVYQQGQQGQQPRNDGGEKMTARQGEGEKMLALSDYLPVHDEREREQRSKKKE